MRKGALYVIYMSDYFPILKITIKLKAEKQSDLRVGKISSNRLVGGQMMINLLLLLA
jgi:hypothetical protein